MHNNRVFSIFQVTKRNVLSNAGLTQEFTQHPSLKTGQEVDTTVGRVLYQEMLVRVINTMANSFFQSQIR